MIKLISNTNEQVVLEFSDISALDKALNPWYPNARYVTVTKGKGKRIYTFVPEDAKSWSVSQYTLVSDDLDRTMRSIVNYIEHELYIPLELTNNNIVEANIYYNPHYHSWQLSLRNSKNENANLWFRNCANVDEAIAAASAYITVKNWRKGIAQTGIDIWRAEL